MSDTPDNPDNPDTPDILASSASATSTSTTGNEPGTAEQAGTLWWDGSRRWTDTQGRLHRIGAPAVESPDGGRRWYANGQCHRIDGPAVTDGRNGNQHMWVVRDVEIREGIHVLDELYRNGDTDTLSHVLSVWTPTGPDVGELLGAIKAAAA